MREQMENWLRQLPGLERLQREWLEEQPGCAGLFYLGARTVEVNRDVLGNALVRQRLRWKIAVNGEKPVKIPVETAPTLGLLQQASIENWHVAFLDELRLPRWEAELTVEFTAALGQEKGEVAANA